MPAITIRNLPVETHRALKQRAVRNGTSAEAQVRAILKEVLQPEEQVGLGTKLVAITRKYGGFRLNVERDKSPARHPSFQ